MTGEGDMLPVSTDLVVPGSEGITDELVQDVTDAEAAATEGQSILDERAAAIQDRKTTRRTRIQTHRDEVRARKASNGLNSGTDDYLKDLNRVPRLALQWIPNTDGTDESEILRVRNPSNVSVELLRIESIQNPRDAVDLTITIAPDDTFDLLSNAPETDTDGARSWTQKDVCPPAEADDGDGVYLTVRRSGATKAHELAVLCTPEEAPPRTTAASSKTGKQKTPNKRRGPKQSKRGKGQ